jgi:cytochrome c-type biogenesis protein
MMSLSLIPAAFLAGVLMFLAPCTLPIVPGYLAFIAGSVDAKRDRGRILRNAFAFVLGFSIVFIALGASAGFIGGFAGEWRGIISRIAGGILILFGLTMLGVPFPGLSGERHIRLPKFLSIGKWESSLLIGALFALGWSPCIGPILATVLFLAAGSQTAVWGAFLLAVFSLGLGLPFIITAALMESGQNIFGKWAAISMILSKIGGIFLILIGILMLVGNSGLLVEWGFKFLEAPYGQLLKYM